MKNNWLLDLILMLWLVLIVTVITNAIFRDWSSWFKILESGFLGGVIGYNWGYWTK